MQKKHGTFGKIVSVLNWSLQALECVFQGAKSSRNCSSQVTQLFGRASKLQKLKLNVEKVLLEGLALYRSHGKCFIGLNENRNKPGIILLLNSTEKSKYPLPWVVIRKIQRRTIVIHPGMSRLTAWTAVPSSQKKEEQRV